MKKIVSLLIIVIALAAPASQAASLSEQGDSAYTADDYQRAAALYTKAAEIEGTSSTLFYNLGNTYYRMGQLGKAILNYERALKLDPTNEDARANLAYVNSRIIDQPGDRGSVMSKIIDDTASSAHSNTWSWISLGCFTLLLGAVAVYIFSDNVALRKVSFFGGLALFALTIAGIILAIIAADKATSTERAVVIAPSTQLSTSPRQPKDKTEQAMLLHEGTVVEIIDSVATPADSVNPVWFDVRVDNANRAWISKSDTERI